MTENINRATGNGVPPFAIRAVRKLWRVVVDRPYRRAVWLYLARPRGAFQPFNNTERDRYPGIFSFVQSTLGRDQMIKILSYGCSTGEEVFSLRNYFPRATIKGTDINAANIAVCRRRLDTAPDDGILFETAASTEAEPSGIYDAIFCMAVLRHSGLGLAGITRCDPLLRFEDFARAVANFERCLKPGGLLVIRYSHFRLCDAPVGERFETLLRVPHGAQKPLIFGPDNRLLPDSEYPDTVFRKKLSPAPAAQRGFG
ncbi:MAG TPA: class I SAM-dependent methyltransferase [Xanthobacteraceae bacterium]|nr:class I SAM-dependent methyltransferase [Xanthobacteraceae bacterium]